METNQPPQDLPISSIQYLVYLLLIGWSEDLTFFPANLLATTEETKSNITQENMHLEHKYTTTQNKHKKLKPGLLASCNIRTGNGVCLYL